MFAKLLIFARNPHTETDTSRFLFWLLSFSLSFCYIIFWNEKLMNVINKQRTISVGKWKSTLSMESNYIYVLTYLHIDIINIKLFFHVTVTAFFVCKDILAGRYSYHHMLRFVLKFSDSYYNLIFTVYNPHKPVCFRNELLLPDMILLFYQVWQHLKHRLKVELNVLYLSWFVVELAAKMFYC